MRCGAQELFLGGLFVASLTGMHPAAVAQSTAPQVPTDWDLWMLKLVNAARTDPSAENLLRGTSYSNPAVPPLAYSPAIGRAAANHNGWMSANANNPAINDPTNNGPAPDSFTHRETFNAQSNGDPAVGTPGYTGASAGQRLSYAGYGWSSWGENIRWSSFPSAIGAGITQNNHVGWWNSSGHRSNLMNSAFTTFGYHGLSESDHWATQNFSRPSGSTRTHLLGVLYDDLDESGAWEPRGQTDPGREGLGGVTYRVYNAASGAQVGSDSQTFDNGGFTFLAGAGTYDLRFLLAGDDLWVRDVTVAGANVDLGDLSISGAMTPVRGDLNGDGVVTTLDIDPFVLALTEPDRFARDFPGVDALAAADFSGDGVVNTLDIDPFVATLTGAATADAAPEPAAAAVLAFVGLAASGRRRV